MRRLVLFAAAVLAVAAAPAARAEPLDVELARLGSPDPGVWTSVYFVRQGGTLSAADAAQLASDSRRRFAILSTQVALALSSAVLQPASTTGHSGFAVDLEAATVSVHADPVGAGTLASGAGVKNQVWAVSGSQPSQLYLPSVHVRKGLPWSFEVGGRLIYLAGSNAFAGQGEVKWAFNEGFDYVPDLAARVAYTRLFGMQDWNLSTADVDFMISKRWGLMGVTSLTPYLVARFSYVRASSDAIDFAPPAAGYAPNATDVANTQAAFPAFSTGFYRTTAGVRFTASAVSLALEGTYFGGGTISAKGYEGAKVASSFGGAAKLGWEW